MTQNSKEISFWREFFSGVALYTLITIGIVLSSSLELRERTFDVFIRALGL